MRVSGAAADETLICQLCRATVVARDLLRHVETECSKRAGAEETAP